MHHFCVKWADGRFLSRMLSLFLSLSLSRLLSRFLSLSKDRRGPGEGAAGRAGRLMNRESGAKGIGGAWEGGWPALGPFQKGPKAPPTLPHAPYATSLRARFASRQEDRFQN